MLVSNSSAKRLANPNFVYVTGTDNFCLDAIKEGMKVLLPHIIIFFWASFWTNGFSSSANELFHLPSVCLLSKKVSVEHWELAVLVKA